MKPPEISQRLLLLGIGAIAAFGLSRGAAAQQYSAAPSAESPANSLAEQLTEQGWKSTREADGSVTFSATADQAPNKSETTAGNTDPAPQGAAPAHRLADDLKAKLTAAGWIPRTEADGSVILTRAARPLLAAAPESATKAAKKTSPATPAPHYSIADDLKAKLRAAGWISRTEPDGSIILTHPADQSTTAPEPPATTAEHIKPVAAPVRSLADDLKAKLTAAGWASRTEADGSIILTQSAGQADALSAQPATPATKHGSSSITEPAHSLADHLKAELMAAGWTSRSEADGSLILTRSAK